MIPELFKSSLLRRLLESITPELAVEMDSFLDVMSLDNLGDPKNIINEEKVHLFPALAACRASIKSIEGILEEHLVEIRKIVGLPKLQYISKNNEDFVIEVPKGTKKIPENWHKLASPKTADRYHTQLIREQLVLLEQAKEKLQLESNSVWAGLLRKFSGHYSKLRAVISALAQLDCLFCLVNLARQAGYVRPTMTDSGDLTVTAGRHPIVETLLREPFVPNDTHMHSESVTCAILTGPNMGGKTSYARQVALIAIMAQIGSFVPAEAATITPVDAILTRMGAADDEIRGQSTFFVELQETAEILRCATDRSLVILDEVRLSMAPCSILTNSSNSLAEALLPMMDLLSRMLHYTTF